MKHEWTLLELSAVLTASWTIVFLFDLMRESSNDWLSLLGKWHVIVGTMLGLAAAYGYGLFQSGAIVWREGSVRILMSGRERWLFTGTSVCAALIAYYLSLLIIAWAHIVIADAMMSDSVREGGNIVTFFHAGRSIGMIGNLLGAIGEECVYRAAMYECARTYPLWLVVVASSALFALTHLATVDKTVALIVFALLATVLRSVTNGMVAPLAFHMAVNIMN